jgi:hypothetical protein
MKYLLNRLTALTLAILVLISAVPLVGATDRPDPFCTLGTFSGDMLAGGSRVQTEDGLFYVGDDGYVYQSNRGRTPVYAKQAACLNYVDGVLYMARLHDGGFDLVGYDVASGTETVYLDNFSGELRQLYVVDGSRMVFLVDHSVMELSLETRAFRMIRFAENLWSFVPTGCGLIWASGTLFDYRLHADNYLIAEHVDGYYVDFETNDGVLVYTQGGVNYQIDLGYAFVGEAQPSAYTGVSLVNVSAGDETLDEDVSLLPVSQIAMTHWNYSPIDSTDYVLMAGTNQQGDVCLWRKVSQYGGDSKGGQWVFMPIESDNHFVLTQQNNLSLVYLDKTIYALGSDKTVYTSRDQGITWHPNSNYALPDDVQGTKFVMTSDSQGNLWLVTNGGQVWKR